MMASNGLFFLVDGATNHQPDLFGVLGWGNEVHKHLSRTIALLKPKIYEQFAYHSLGGFNSYPFPDLE